MLVDTTQSEETPCVHLSQFAKVGTTVTPEQKAEIVRRHLIGKEPVSNLADEFGLQPSLIHGWINQVMAQAERAFGRPSGKRRIEEAKERKIAHLEAKPRGRAVRL